MAIVTKTIPYEILLRFSHGAEHQTSKPGDLEGAQYIEMQIFQDDETGNVLHHKIGEAQVLPPEKVQEYIGTSFPALDEQIRRLKQTVVEKENEKQALLQEAQKVFDELNGKLAKATDDLAIANGQLDANRAEA